MFVGDAQHLDKFSGWLDEFELAMTNRVVGNNGRHSFVVDIVSLNRLMSVAIDFAPCLDIVTAQEFSGLTANLQRHLSAVIATHRQPGGLGQEPSEGDVIELNAALRFTAPYLQRLGVLLRNERQTSPHQDAGKRAGKTAGGRTVANEAHEDRKRVAERWDEFSQTYKALGYSRRSWQHFAAWASQEFDNMPSDDANELKRMFEAHRKTPAPQTLV